jgi:cytochrome c peroxidase
MTTFYRTNLHALALLVAVTTFTGCDNSSDPKLREIIFSNDVEPVEVIQLSPEKVELGRALFFDKVLSGNMDISCATCHHPTLATADGISLSVGTGGLGLGPDRDIPLDDDDNPIFIPRNAPDIFNRAHMKTMFWDGRVTDLENGSFLSPAGDDLLDGLESALAVQAMFPVTSRDEMRGQVSDSELGDLDDDDLIGMWDALMERLLGFQGYKDLFAAAYPSIEEDDLTFAHAANAIAAFEIQHWTLANSPFDQYLRGDNSILNADQYAGAQLFFGTAGCVACHSGPNLSDEMFHNTGVVQLGPGKGDGIDGRADFGREQVTGLEEDRYKFRTPPLRNVMETGPWMHDGAFTDMTKLVSRYNDIADSATNFDVSQLDALTQEQVNGAETENIIENLDPLLPDFQLSEEQIQQLVAFLGALSDPDVATLPDIDIPNSVPSGLPVAD